MVKLQATGVLSDPSPTSALRGRHPDAARSEVLWLLSSGVVASAIVGSLLACGFCWLTIPAATNQTTEVAALPRRQFVLPKTTALTAPIQAGWAHDIPALAQPAILERTTTLLPFADAASPFEFDRSFAHCYPTRRLGPGAKPTKPSPKARISRSRRELTTGYIQSRQR